MDINIRLAIYRTDLATVRELLAGDNHPKIYDHYRIEQDLSLIERTLNKQLAPLMEFRHGTRSLNPQGDNWSYLSEAIYLMNLVSSEKSDDHLLQIKQIALNDLLDVIIYLIEEGASLKDTHFDFFDTLEYNQWLIHEKNPELRLSDAKLREIFNACFDSGFDVNKVINNRTPYGQFRMFFRDHGQMLQFFLQKGMNVNAHVSDGFTPLMLAVLFHPYADVLLLLDEGADISTKTKESALLDRTRQSYRAKNSISLYKLRNIEQDAEKLSIGKLLRAEQLLKEGALSPERMIKRVLHYYALFCLAGQKPELFPVIKDAIPGQLLTAFAFRMTHRLETLQHQCNQIEAYVRLGRTSLEPNMLTEIMSYLVSEQDPVFQVMQKITGLKEKIMSPRLVSPTQSTSSSESKHFSNQDLPTASTDETLTEQVGRLRLT